MWFWNYTKLLHSLNIIFIYATCILNHNLKLYIVKNCDGINMENERVWLKCFGTWPIYGIIHYYIEVQFMFITVIYRHDCDEIQSLDWPANPKIMYAYLFTIAYFWFTCYGRPVQTFDIATVTISVYFIYPQCLIDTTEYLCKFAKFIAIKISYYSLSSP